MNKMINKVAKGTRKEKACADELRAQGYLIWKVIRVRYQSLDLWGLFDVAALHPDGDHILLVQTKSNRCDVKSRDAIQALKVPSGIRKEIWIWKDRKYWIKEYYE